MQLEMQSQVPASLGLICSRYMLYVCQCCSHLCVLCALVGTCVYLSAHLCVLVGSLVRTCWLTCVYLLAHLLAH